MRLRILIVCLLFVQSSCFALRPNTKGRVQHVVLVWLKEDIPDTAPAKLLEATEEFRSIPGVLEVSGGTAVVSSRAIVDSSFDLGFVIELENQTAIQTYLEHPIHRQALTRLFKPFVKRVLIYDIASR